MPAICALNWPSARCCSPLLVACELSHHCRQLPVLVPGRHVLIYPPAPLAAAAAVAWMRRARPPRVARRSGSLPPLPQRLRHLLNPVCRVRLLAAETTDIMPSCEGFQRLLCFRVCL